MAEPITKTRVRWTDEQKNNLTSDALEFTGTRHEFFDTQAKKLGRTTRAIKEMCEQLGLTASVISTKSTGLTIQEKKVIELLNKKPHSISMIIDKTDYSHEEITTVINSLQNKAYEIEKDHQFNFGWKLNKARPLASKTRVIQMGREMNSLKFGVVSDTHLCSVNQQLTLLHEAYEDMAEKGCEFAILPGDISEGQNMHTDQARYILPGCLGADAQTDYIVENFPVLQSGTGKTYVGMGNHDYSFMGKQSFGYNIIRGICNQRDDLIHQEGRSSTFSVQGMGIKVIHPAGGTGYARSYKLQNAIRDMGMELRNENIKILLMGHYHVANYLPYYGGIEGFLVPCLQSQTEYLTTKMLAPVIGWLIIEVLFDDDGNIEEMIPNFRIRNHRIIENDY